MLVRCPWAEGSDLERDYHDTQWGVPVRDDALQFEFLVLESFQAGLSWAVVLRKRENFRRAMDGFDAEAIARYGPADAEQLMNDAGIIRNRKKIEATIANARAFLALRDESDGFAQYIWDFVDGEPIVNAWERMEDVPAVTDVATQLSKDMKRRGFSFVGPTVMYAHMQATGLVNDHLVSCFRYAELTGQ